MIFKTGSGEEGRYELGGMVNENACLQSIRDPRVLSDAFDWAATREGERWVKIHTGREKMTKGDVDYISALVNLSRDGVFIGYPKVEPLDASAVRQMEHLHLAFDWHEAVGGYYEWMEIWMGVRKPSQDQLKFLDTLYLFREELTSSVTQARNLWFTTEDGIGDEAVIDWDSISNAIDEYSEDPTRKIEIVCLPFDPRRTMHGVKYWEGREYYTPADIEYLSFLLKYKPRDGSNGIAASTVGSTYDSTVRCINYTISNHVWGTHAPDRARADGGSTLRMRDEKLIRWWRNDDAMIKTVSKDAIVADLVKDLDEKVKAAISFKSADAVSGTGEITPDKFTYDSLSEGPLSDSTRAVRIRLCTLVITGDVQSLSYAFIWKNTPHGIEHWKQRKAGQFAMSENDRKYVAWVRDHYMNA